MTSGNSAAYLTICAGNTAALEVRHGQGGFSEVVFLMPISSARSGLNAFVSLFFSWFWIMNRGRTVEKKPHTHIQERVGEEKEGSDSRGWIGEDLVL